MTANLTRKPLKKIHDDVEYYPHQLEGIRKLANETSFLLADDMGLGKTLQAITVAAIDFERDRASRVLVVTPASLKWNWQDEFKQFTSFTVMVLNGAKDERETQLRLFDLMDLDVLIVNYEQVASHLTMLNRLHFDIIMYDEAHYIKNWKSKRTKASLALRGKRYFLLTGSPLLNQVNELWTLLHRIDPGKFPSYWGFVNRYCTFGGYQRKQITGTKNRHELKAHIDAIMLRRLKKDVLDLPDKQHIVVRVELTEMQRKLYDQANDELKIDLPSNPEGMELENALTKYLKLKQICGTTACIEGYGDESAKLDMLEQMVAQMLQPDPDNPPTPLVVFTQFRMVQACAIKRLEAQGVLTFCLNGDTPNHMRTEVVRQWADARGDDGRPPVMVAMLQVAGVGLNMTAADKCIFLDKLYVPKLNEQGEDRIHRIGADKSKPVQIYTIIARKTVEQKIESILNTKRKLFDSMVEVDQWKKALYDALMEDDDDD